jgi:2-hydroxychromene-2-carboxylate isomerase
MSLRTTMRTMAVAGLTSGAFRDLRRSAFAARRKLSGKQPTVHYFHQADDPYSHLAAQLLHPLLQRYYILIEPWLVPPPDDSAAPDRHRLEAYALRDAERLARRYRLQFPAGAKRPSPELRDAAHAAFAAALHSQDFPAWAPVVGKAIWRGDTAQLRTIAAEAPAECSVDAALRKGEAERRRLRHYLGAMFYFEGEWYWGVDRLHHLETRLRELGLDNSPHSPPLAPYQRELLTDSGRIDAGIGERPVIEAWFSFRSPYTYIGVPRIAALARHYGAELRPRCILPMVMRGLPVPAMKTLYIALDTKREADLIGVPFGRIADPVGRGAERALAVFFRAQALGLGLAFAEAAMAGSFAQGIDLADDGGLFSITRSVGLPDEEVRAALADDSWRALAEQNRVALLEAGLWGAPTFRVNGSDAHWGQDRIWALEEDVMAALHMTPTPSPVQSSSLPA